jgi:DNA-binding transcriptional LysR family regulator
MPPIKFVDIMKENFDIALRVHSDPLSDSDLVQRTLATTHIMLFAGVRYLAEHGEPVDPADLARHSAASMMREPSPGTWCLKHTLQQKEDVAVTLHARLVSEDVWTLQKAALQGIGVVALPFVSGSCAFRIAETRASGMVAGPATMTALLPHREGMLPAVRAFLDRLSDEVRRS